MTTANFTTNGYAKQEVYGLQYAEDAVADGATVRLPAISKYGCVRPHSTGEYHEQVSAKLDRKAKSMKALCKAEAKRRAARESMFGL